MTQTPADAELEAAALSGRHPADCVLCFNVSPAHDYTPEVPMPTYRLTLDTLIEAPSINDALTALAEQVGDDTADVKVIDTEDETARLSLREALNFGILALNTLLEPSATSEADAQALDDNAESAALTLAMMRDVL